MLELTDKIFEFKVDKGRILVFFTTKRRVHGFVKKSAKTPRNEIVAAEKVKKEIERRSCNEKN